MRRKKNNGNPFLPYDEDLWVMHLSATHTMLLNKFNLVDHHVLVITRDFQQQNIPLTREDISATWSVIHVNVSLGWPEDEWTVLQCMPEGGIAFFNCGPLSGASQPHKHLQIVPLPLSATSPIPLDITYKASLDRGSGSRLDLPFCAFGVSLNEDIDANGIHEAYTSLLVDADPWLKDTSASYNVVWTKEWLIIIPRSKQKHGPCDLNSLGFAGTFFVRSDEELEHIKAHGPMSVLQNVAFPNSPILTHQK